MSAGPPLVSLPGEVAGTDDLEALKVQRQEHVEPGSDEALRDICETADTKVPIGDPIPVISSTSAMPAVHEEGTPGSGGLMAMVKVQWSRAKTIVTNLKPYVKAMGMTLFTTFLSLTFIVTITNIDPDSYQPCNDPDTSGCVYLKIYAAGNVDTTQGYFASVQNGHEEIVMMDPLRAFEGTPMWWRGLIDVRAGWTFMTAPALGDVSTYQPPALCPNMTTDAMHRYCERGEMKAEAQNHLLGPGRDVFLGLTTLWCVLRIVHDWLVLQQQRQRAAYTAFAALVMRGAAASTAAYWAFGSTSVFVSVSKTDDCACFYQMPAVQALLTLVSPLLLLKGGYLELFDWLRGVIHGDYLQFQPHRIPHHVELSSGSWVSGHLMVWREAIVPQPRMAVSVYKQLAALYMLLVALWEIASLLFIAPLAPSTLVRAEEVVVKFLDSSSNDTAYATRWLYRLLDWAIYFTAWTSLATVAFFAYTVYQLCNKLLSKKIEKKKAPAAVFVVVFSALFGVVCLCVFSMSVSSPQSGLSHRERMVMKAELRAVGQYVGAAFLSLFAVCAASFSDVELIQALSGHGDSLKKPSEFLKLLGCTSCPTFLAFLVFQSPL